MKSSSDGKSRRAFLKNVALGGAGVAFSGLAGRMQAWGDVTSSSAPPVTVAGRTRIPLHNAWRFQKETPAESTDLPQSTAAFDDQSWEVVGVPHCYNDLDCYENGPESRTFQGNAWYRTHFSLPVVAKGKKVFLEFQGVSNGSAVYINGKFKPGNTKVAQPGDVTHVGEFLPFALDITDEVTFGGDNVLAVRVGNISGKTGYGGDPGNGDNPDLREQILSKSFYTNPGFGNTLTIGMGLGGMVCPVFLFLTNQVHIPSNFYSPLEKWGTYVGVVSASDETATIRAQTNVENESDAPVQMALVTRVIDATGRVVLTMNNSRLVKPKEIALFDQHGDVAQPHLWYPNNSAYGKPYLYRVVSVALVGGAAVDFVETPLGIRMITWDSDYCYVNGKKHILNGFGHRNMYPALGSAITASLLWNDVRLIAECGGNFLRVGHVPAMQETVKACDAYGVLIIQQSGDNEWSLKGEPALTYKKEYDRDSIIGFRNHPSIAVWESNNGLASDNAHYSPKSTIELVDQWDYIQPRIVGSRDTSDYFPTDRKIMIGYTNRYQKIDGSPSINWEVYGANWGGRSFEIARFDYDDEKVFADHYVTDYLDNLNHKACGWVVWMLAETEGEPYVTYLNGMKKQKSLGSCAMDGNRFPKLTYEIFKNALWIPYATRPGVALQSNWNLSGKQDVDAWSNCPKVELFLNDVSQGVMTPDAKLRCTWPGIAWRSGTLKAVGLDDTGSAVCSDILKSSGDPHGIVLAVEPQAIKPSGEKFQITANGSDAAIITARIVDAQEILCRTASNNIRFTVTGPGSYRGSYNFYVVPDKPLSYHAPGDPELQAEGGLMRVAVRSTFQPGVVTIEAVGDGLAPGRTSFLVEPLTA